MDKIQTAVDANRKNVQAATIKRQRVILQEAFKEPTPLRDLETRFTERKCEALLTSWTKSFDRQSVDLQAAVSSKMEKSPQVAVNIYDSFAKSDQSRTCDLNFHNGSTISSSSQFFKKISSAQQGTPESRLSSEGLATIAAASIPIAQHQSLRRLSQCTSEVGSSRNPNCVGFNALEVDTILFFYRCTFSMSPEACKNGIRNLAMPKALRVRFVKVANGKENEVDFKGFLSHSKEGKLKPESRVQNFLQFILRFDDEHFRNDFDCFAKYLRAYSEILIVGFDIKSTILAMAKAIHIFCKVHLYDHRIEECPDAIFACAEFTAETINTSPYCKDCLRRCLDLLTPCGKGD